MGRMVTVSSKPHESTSRGDRTLNTWIAIAAIIILIMALLLVKLHVDKLEHPSLSTGQVYSRQHCFSIHERGSRDIVRCFERLTMGDGGHFDSEAR
jgi:hypothetical protein